MSCISTLSVYPRQASGISVQIELRVIRFTRRSPPPHELMRKTECDVRDSPEASGAHRHKKLCGTGQTQPKLAESCTS